MAVESNRLVQYSPKRRREILFEFCPGIISVGFVLTLILTYYQIQNRYNVVDARVVRDNFRSTAPKFNDFDETTPPPEIIRINIC